MSVKCILANQAKGSGSSTALTLSAIRIQTPPTKTSYLVGEEFDTTGMVVVADYALSGVVVITDVVITGYTYSPQTLAFSDTEVTISYTENRVTKTTT